MMGQPAAVNIVRPFAQKIEHLRKGQRHKEIVGAVRVADAEEGCRAPIPHTVKLQFVIGHDLTKLWNIKGSKPSAAGNQNAFGRLAAAELVFFILLHSKAIRFALFQPLEHIVHGVEKVLVILLYLHAGDHVHQRIHVAILLGSLKNDVAQQGAVQKRFRLRPERVALLVLALGVGNEGIDKL